MAVIIYYKQLKMFRLQRIAQAQLLSRTTLPRATFSMMETTQSYDEILDPEVSAHKAKLLKEQIHETKFQIKEMTQTGRLLAQNASKGVYIDKFEREQRYEIFINKMYQLYKYEKRVERKRKQGFLKMATAPLMTETPIKLVLSEYSNLSSQGFDGRIFSQTLEHLVQVVQGRGNKGRVFSDYSLPEMDISQRMTKVAEDLKYALTSDQFFSSHLLAKSARLMGELGYKNTELLPLWFQKLDQQMNEDIYHEKEIKELNSHELFNNAIYGSYFKLKPQHYVYQGQFQHKEFQDHIRTLVDWQTEGHKGLNSKKESVQEIENAMKQLIDSVKEIKGLQEEQQAAIASLRDQYFKLRDAQDKHAFLQQNKYLRYDMLELQELLVVGGFITPTEALTTSKMVDKHRMKRAVAVFYDFVLNSHNELLSPQYDQIHEAITPKKQELDINEYQNKLNAYTYSSTLIGVAEQAQSYRRDVHGFDYPNKFYEELLIPPTYQNNTRVDEALRIALQKAAPTNVMMERSYLRPWRTFFELTSDVDKKIKQLLDTHTSEKFPRYLDSNIVALRALSACKFGAPDLRSQIYSNIANRSDEINQIKESQILIDGLMGIAHGGDRSEAAIRTAHNLIFPFDRERLEKLNFKEKVELINAICVADLLDEPKTKKIAKSIVQNVVKSLDSLHWDMIDNELNIDTFVKLYESFATIKTSHDQSVRKLNFTNTNLLSALESHDSHLMHYSEFQAASYDPLKPRVVSGLAAGMTQADMELIYANQKGQMFNKGLDGPNKFPFKPDLLLGHKGARLGIFVLNERETMRDTQLADGRVQHHQRLIQRAHAAHEEAAQIVPVSIPLKAVVSYDLDKFQLQLKESFDFSSWIDKAKQIMNSKATMHEIATEPLADLASRLIKLNEASFEAGTASGTIEKFISQFYQLFESKRRLDQMHEPEQLAAGYDELKFHLAKLSLVHDALLSQLDLEQVRQCLPPNQKFSDLIEKLRIQTIAASQENAKHPNFERRNINLEHFNTNWLGTRQTVELPKVKGQHKKAIEPELLNRNFMFNEDYHHYADWKEMMEQTYDQFNMLQLPASKKDIKVFYDPVRHNRRVPYGIFPNPITKRTVLQHASIEPLQLMESQNGRDRFAEFEKDPLRFMRESELAKMKQMKEITPDVSMICNLQNVKQGLKSDFSDVDLASFLFTKLNLTDQLIQDHLSQLNKSETQYEQIKHVPRDPRAFRDFAEKKNSFIAPYSQFYMQEAVKQGYPQGIYEEYTKARRDPNQQEKAAKLLEQLENALVNYRRQNEDFFNLSKALDNHLEVKVDVKALGLLPQSATHDPVSGGLSDKEFLDKHRVWAESALIKSTIVYKLHNKLSLTQNEKKYLDLWVTSARESQSLVAGENLMVPQRPSALKISDMTPQDFYALATIPGVQFDRQTHENFALNDLVLEMAYFVDRDTIKRVELKMLESKLRTDFGLGENFALVEKRNKELDYLHQELEEAQWRLAAKVDQREEAAIKDMLWVGRGVDKFDKVFLELDRKSFDHFFNIANSFDNRTTLLENWICRKEEEYKRRVNLPTKALNNSDEILYRSFDGPRKKARQSLVSKMFVSDEFGVEKTKTYSTLTTAELHMLVESLCVRLNLFNQTYPAFVPQVVKAIMEHENLGSQDRATLDTYCTIFELDWRGDRSIDNREEFLMTNPIYTHIKDQPTSTVHLNKFDETHLQERIHQASTPFLDDLVARIKTQL